MALKDAYLNLVTSQHRNKPKFMATVEKLLDPLDGVFAAATFFDDAFDLDDAQGCQQDLLGEILGQPRALDFRYEKNTSSILDDEAYRVIQKAKIIRNLWDGELGDLYEKWLTIFGAPIRVQDNQDMTMAVLLDIDESDEMQKLMKLTAHGLIVPKPMGVRMRYNFFYPDIHLQIPICQRAECIQIVEARHRAWNLGTARTTRFDSTYRFDRQIRWNGIYGADYREQQHHVVDIWYLVEAVQYNLVPVNVWDGSFAFDRSHRWGGSSMQRLPLHESRGCGIVVLQQARAAALDSRIAAMNCPDVYLANPSNHASTNLQVAHSPQVIKPRQISDSLIAVTAPHRQQWSFSAAPVQRVDSPHKIKIKQSDSSMQRAAAHQTAPIDHASAETGRTAARHAQTIKQPALQVGTEAARGKTKINIDVEATGRAAATLNTDYRTSNLFDGSFCFDGTHTFGGQKLQNYARATHCCSITRITKNGLGRMETT